MWSSFCHMFPKCERQMPSGNSLTNHSYLWWHCESIKCLKVTNKILTCFHHSGLLTKFWFSSCWSSNQVSPLMSFLFYSVYSLISPLFQSKTIWSANFDSIFLFLVFLFYYKLLLPCLFSIHVKQELWQTTCFSYSLCDVYLSFFILHSD